MIKQLILKTAWLNFPEIFQQIRRRYGYEKDSKTLTYGDSDDYLHDDCRKSNMVSN